MSRPFVHPIVFHVRPQNFDFSVFTALIHAERFYGRKCATQEHAVYDVNRPVDGPTYPTVLTSIERT